MAEISQVGCIFFPSHVTRRHGVWICSTIDIVHIDGLCKVVFAKLYCKVIFFVINTYLVEIF